MLKQWLVPIAAQRLAAGGRTIHEVCCLPPRWLLPPSSAKRSSPREAPRIFWGMRMRTAAKACCSTDYMRARVTSATRDMSAKAAATQSTMRPPGTT
eukprot:3155471-Pyramimonas_sp.AAC.1